MALAAPRSFGAHLKSLREAAGFTQEELATIAGLSVHAISALERGERRRPHLDTVQPKSCSATSSTRPAMSEPRTIALHAASRSFAPRRFRGVWAMPSPDSPASPSRAATSLEPNVCSMRPRPCFVRPALGTWRWRCTGARCWQCGGDADHALAIVRESLTRIRDLHDKFAFVHAMVPLAAAAALKGDHAWTARVLGASDVVTERTGAKVLDHAVRDLRSDTERAARAGLGTDRWADAYAAGRSASLDALLQDIDDHAATPLVE